MSTQMAAYQYIVVFETRLMDHTANELPNAGSETAQVSSGEHVSVRSQTQIPPATVQLQPATKFHTASHWEEQNRP